ncbi:MAG: DUF2793 domain-containing protein [Gammaproteobacteria bacterium]|nr:DUF2793 domain-containing protein [Gammaproteobacteria bacterium]
MADTPTDNFSIVKPEIGVGGHGPKVHTFLDKIDSELLSIFVMGQLSVIDKDLTAPPGSPADRDVYIVAAGATGAWAGLDGDVVVWSAGAAAWATLTPLEGWLAWVVDEGVEYRHDGAAWVAITLSGIWTPVVYSGANVAVLSSSGGRYRYSGKKCFVSFNFTMTSKNGMSGTISVSGFPLTPDVTYAPYPIFSTEYAGANLALGSHLVASMAIGGGITFRYINNTGGGNVTDAMITDTLTGYFRGEILLP